MKNKLSSWHSVNLVLTGSLILASIVACADVGQEGRIWQQQAEKMVEEQIQARGIKDPNVLQSMKKVPRHAFVPDLFRSKAYADTPLPIGHEQTISQPYIVALMTELGQVGAGDKVLEIGTGSGYQAAVLAQLGARVYSIEIVEPLATRAERDLKQLGYDSVEVRVGDGYKGWPEEAPFEIILVTASPDHVPQALVEQLTEGGRLVIPVGDNRQYLLRVTKLPGGEIQTEKIAAVRFVPMTGEAEQMTK